MPPYDLEYLFGWYYNFCISLCSAVLDSSSAIIATKAAFLRFILCLWNSNVVYFEFCFVLHIFSETVFWCMLIHIGPETENRRSSFLRAICLLLNRVHISGALRRILNIVHFEYFEWSKLLKPFTCKEVKLPIFILICIPGVMCYVCRTICFQPGFVYLSFQRCCASGIQSKAKNCDIEFQIWTVLCIGANTFLNSLI